MVCTTLRIVRCVKEPSPSGRWAAEDSECQVKAGADRVVASSLTTFRLSGQKGLTSLSTLFLSV